jgi:hypothetical protein
MRMDTIDALDKSIARPSSRYKGILTIVATLIAIAVEIDVMLRVWINPGSGHSGFRFYMLPLLTAFPLILCLSMQIGVRKALRSGDISSKIADTIEVACGILILITYQAIEDLMRFIP